MKILVLIAGALVLEAVAAAQDGPPRATGGKSERRDSAEKTEPGKILKAAGAVDSLDWSPDGVTLAVQAKPGEGATDKSRTIQVWNARTGQIARTLLRTPEAIFSVTFSPGGNSLACVAWRDLKGGPDESEIRQWNMATGEHVNTFKGANLEGLGLPFTSDLLSIAYSPDGSLVAACGKLVSDGTIIGQHIGGEVCVFDARTREMKWFNRTTHTDIVYAIVFSPDGTLLASGGIDKLIRLWDPRTGELRKTLSGAAWEGITSLAFSSDGKILASGGSGVEEGGVVRLWNVESGRVLHRFNAFRPRTTVRVAVAPKSTRLFAIGESQGQEQPAWQLRSWDMSSGQSHGMLDERKGFARAISVSRDGKSLAVGTWEGDVLLYDIGANRS